MPSSSASMSHHQRPAHHGEPLRVVLAHGRSRRLLGDELGLALTALYAPNGWIGGAGGRSGSRSPTRRSASSSRWSSSACRSWCARCSRCWPDLDREVEEAAPDAGRDAAADASGRVMLPALAPALLTGVGLAFARARRRIRLGDLHRRQHADEVRDRAAADRHQARAVRLRRRGRDRPGHAGRVASALLVAINAAQAALAAARAR